MISTGKILLQSWVAVSVAQLRPLNAHLRERPVARRLPGVQVDRLLEALQTRTSATECSGKCCSHKTGCAGEPHEDFAPRDKKNKCRWASV